MWSLLPLVVVPLVVMLGIRHMKPEHAARFTVKEFLVLEFGMLALLTAGFFIARAAALADTEVWSGTITAKNHGTQGCCHCRTVCDSRDSKGNCTASHQECDHGHDYWWSLSVSTGDEISIRSCSGSSFRPDAWEQAVIGEPAAVEHSYQNYLLADPDSVLRQSGTLEGNAPSYPRVHSFYRIERALNLGTRMDTRDWSRQLDVLNAKLGNAKWVNVIVVATTNTDPGYAKVIERDWLYGKMNDAIFVLGAPDGETVAWAEVVTLPTGNSALRVAGREDLIGARLSDPAEAIARIEKVVLTEWKWAGLEELAYLGWAARPSPGALVFLYLLGIVGAVWGAFYMIENDVFREERGHSGPYASRFPFRRNGRF